MTENAPDVQVTNVAGSQAAIMTQSEAATPSDPSAPLVQPEAPAVPAMPEGGQEKYYDAKTGAYNWEAAFKEEAWKAAQQQPQTEPQAAAEPAPTDAGQGIPGGEQAAAEAGISNEEFNAAVMENGGVVPDEILAKFPGIDPEIIQDYAASKYEQAFQHIETVQNFLGGDNGMALLRDYMGKNFQPAEIQAFEQQLMDPGTWRAAAMTLLQAAGLPQGGQGVVKGPNAAPSAMSGETFGSDAEFNQALRDPRYKSDPAYRARVQAALQNSPHIMSTGPAYR